MPASPDTGAPPVLALVDGDVALRAAISFAMEARGVAVAAFGDAEAALEAANRPAWRGLVLDVNLPRMSGLDLLLMLRSEGLNAPALFITTQPSRATRARALAMRADILEKPLLDDTLASWVQRVWLTPA